MTSKLIKRENQNVSWARRRITLLILPSQIWIRLPPVYGAFEKAFFCSVPLSWVNKGNELGNWKELLSGQLFQVPRDPFHVFCFPVANNILFTLKMREDTLWQAVLMVRCSEFTRGSELSLPVRSWGTEWKQLTPPGSRFNERKRKGQIYSHSTCPPWNTRFIRMQSYSPRREASLPHWVFGLGVEVRSLGTFSLLCDSESWYTLHFSVYNLLQKKFGHSPWHIESSLLTRDWTNTPSLKTQSLNHWLPGKPHFSISNVSSMSLQIFPPSGSNQNFLMTDHMLNIS